MITLIAAVASNGVIGTADGKLPWKIPEEMQFFKQTTIGNTVIMGRKTYNSLRKPLIDRNNIVISGSLTADMLPDGVSVFPSLEQGITEAESYGKEIFIIGGAVLYKSAIDICNRMLLSHLTFPVEGDVLFPTFNKQDFTEKVIAEFPLFTTKEYLRK